MVYSTHAPHDELNGGFMWVFEHSIDTVIDMSPVVAQSVQQVVWLAITSRYLK